MEELSINLQGECEDKPHPAMLEECKPKYQIDCDSFLLIYKLIRFLFTWKYGYGFLDKLTIEETNAYLDGPIWGILRGLESFSQLIFESSDHSMVIIEQWKLLDKRIWTKWKVRLSWSK